jgi:PAS domain S-box-containing protein
VWLAGIFFLASFLLLENFLTKRPLILRAANIGAVIGIAVCALAIRRIVAEERLRRITADFEERLRERTSLLEESQRMALIGSFRWDARTHTNIWSDELFIMHGMEPAPFAPAQGYRDLIHPDDFDTVHARLARSYETLEPYDDDYRIVLPSGEVRWIHAHGEPVKDADGSFIGLQGTCQDVTERKEAELALASSEERFRALVQSAPDAVVVIDANGVISLVNESAVALLGYEPDELIGRDMFVLVPPELRENYAARRMEYMGGRTERASGEDLFALRRDGSRVSIDITVATVHTPDGPLLVASMRDVTVRRQTEEALREAYEHEREVAENLRQLDASKTTFLQAVSHELRTPLTAISGIASLLDAGVLTPGDGRYEDMIVRLVANSRRLGTLLDDLLDLDRLSRGIIEARRRPTDVSQLIANTIAVIDKRDHPLLVEDEPAIANVDSAQVERIVENLVANAVKHTPSGTTIWVRAIGRDDGVEIVVEDAGPGVLPEIRDSLFEPFVKDTRGHVPGTGIGLSLVYRLAEVHGGNVWVEDRDGGGASFHVWLPNATAPEPERASVDAA